MGNRMKGGESISTIERGYGNIAMYSPNGDIMFYTNQRKLNFYIKKNLVNKIADNAYQLTFKPKGLGYSDPRNAYGGVECLVPRENKCVVSGDTNIFALSKHHIVPSHIRKHFPIEHKSNFQLVVLVRRDIHSDYTIEEQKFYDVIARRFGVPSVKKFIRGTNSRCRKLAKSLFLYYNQIPEQRLIDMKLAFMHETGIEPTMDNLREYAKSTIDETKEPLTPENNFGAALASKITDYREFELIWLYHFIKYTQPKFLPEDLIKSYNLEHHLKTHGLI